MRVNWETVLAAVVTALCALLGTYMSNRKQTAVMEYRLKVLEDKVGKHNNLEARTIVLETEMQEVQRFISGGKTA